MLSLSLLKQEGPGPRMLSTASEAEEQLAPFQELKIPLSFVFFVLVLVFVPLTKLELF